MEKIKCCQIIQQDKTFLELLLDAVEKIRTLINEMKNMKIKKNSRSGSLIYDSSKDDIEHVDPKDDRCQAKKNDELLSGPFDGNKLDDGGKKSIDEEKEMEKEEKREDNGDDREDC